jgi:hypothetical protein
VSAARAEPPEVNLQVKKTLRVFVYIIIDGAAAVYLLPGSHKSVRDSASRKKGCSKSRRVIAPSRCEERRIESRSQKHLTAIKEHQ